MRSARSRRRGNVPTPSAACSAALALSMTHTGYANFAIGNGYVGAATHVHGVIDEVLISHKSLTASQVSILYKSGVGRTYPFAQ